MLVIKLKNENGEVIRVNATKIAFYERNMRVSKDHEPSTFISFYDSNYVIVKNTPEEIDKLLTESYTYIKEI